LVVAADYGAASSTTAFERTSIDQRLQGFAVEGGGQGLIFGGHTLSVADATDGPVGLRLVHLGIMSRTGPMYLGGTMKVIRRITVTTLAAAGLFASMTGPATADVIEDVPQHKHCLLTPNGWVPIAEGVSVEAYEQDAPALDQLHGQVHTGTPTDDGGLTIKKIDADQDCPA